MALLLRSTESGPGKHYCADRQTEHCCNRSVFIHNIKEKLPNSTLIGLGGSFDVWAGVIERAPKIYQKLGLEWLYRTLKEPKRFKRIFPTLPLFVLKVLKERFSR